MITNFKNLTDLPEWKALLAHYDLFFQHPMRDLFHDDPLRCKHFSLSVNTILLDYSRNLIDEKTLSLLINLANARELPKKITALFAGEPVNITEKRPALHTALRDLQLKDLSVNGENVAEKIREARQKMFAFVDKVTSGEWKSATGKTIQYVVNIGIGGSYIGPMLGCHALKDFALSAREFYFISSVDRTYLNEVLEKIELDRTLFIVSSKSFSTLETLTNAKTILKMAQEKLGANVMQHQFIAVTAAKEKALQFGFAAENIFPLWDFVGGRYSVWSAIGLPLALMIGSQPFSEFLQGAHEMDQHFKTAPFNSNMPVLLGLLSIWYINFFHTKAHAIIPYCYRLRDIVPYLQQLEMESNGKRVSLAGNPLPYPVSTVIFGDEGCNAQHAFNQLLHQGNQLIPTDFILVAEPDAATNDQHHTILLASALSQAQALLQGNTEQAEEATLLSQHKLITGNRPCNILILNKLTPKSFGNLLALYEHKIFVEGVIWGINSFDQWGVELGKQLLPDILAQLKGEKANVQNNIRDLITELKAIQEPNEP